MHRIEQRLRLSMGLDAATIGSSSIQRTIRLRMKAAGVATIDEYHQLINTSTAEWTQLIEAVVVTETWFYRDRQALAALATFLLTDWLPAHSTGRARILSLPCSSGEEPYSISMALIEAGISPARFSVDGVDLSQRALQKAAEGLYGRNSFRGQDLDYRDRHFHREGELYSVKQSIRECVRFHQANLLSDGFSLPGGAYDYIFCRNLLIYFDRETQRRAFQRLESLLTPQGTLFVRPAEVPLAMEHGFSSISVPMAFACRRVRAMASGHKTVSSRRPAAGLRRVRVAPTPPAPVMGASVKPGGPPPRPAANPAKLAEARHHADKGSLDEAARLCRAHLDQHGASVDAYYLLGVIHDAMGRPEARDYYRKALYLDPNHYESLLQMAFLVEREGDDATARNLRRRAQRLELKTNITR